MNQRTTPPQEPPSNATAYADLAPQEVLEALDAVGLRGDGRLLQLNSYENRVYQVFLESGAVVVVKFYRPGRWSDAQILEEHAFALELGEAEIPVVAPWPLTVAASDSHSGDGQVQLSGAQGTLAHWSRHGHTWRFAVTPRKAGRSPELDDPDTLRWIGRFLGRMHEVGARSLFQERRTLNAHTWGWGPRKQLIEAEWPTPAERAAWEDASAQALEAVEQCFAQVGPTTALRLHGDAHPGNMLWRPEGPHVVDLDDACNGPAIQDLWMLLSGHPEEARRQRNWLLEGYETVRDFDDAQWPLIEALRTLRMVHHSAWIAQRWEDPAFPRAFPHFGTAAYWSEQVTQLREQAERLRDPSDTHA